MVAQARVYEITDPTLTDIYGAPVTKEMLREGVLLDDEQAAWYVANQRIRLKVYAPGSAVTNTPVRPVLLSAIFAPTVLPQDTGKQYLMQAFNDRMKLVEFDRDAFGLGDPGDIAKVMNDTISAGAQ